MSQRFLIRHLATLSLTLLLSVCTLSTCRGGEDPSGYPAAEEAVIAQLRTIYAAQETYRSLGLGGGVNPYGTLLQLRNAGLVSWATPDSFVQDGYSFHDLATPNERAWGIGAFPAGWQGRTARVFTVTMDGRIRGRVVGYLPSDITSARNDTYWPTIESIGDLDGSGVTEVTDAVAALRYMTGLIQLTEAQSRRADVTRDARVDVRDAISILKIALNGFLNYPYPSY